MNNVRWQQRLHNFEQALSQLNKFLTQPELNELEEQGLIQAFEYTHELAWKTTKDFLISRGVDNLFGSKDTARTAFKLGLIANGDIWMDMIESRNLTSHTYNKATSDKIITQIKAHYQTEFKALFKKLSQLASEA
ncbi:MAG: nucleotidyltransferase substrate binding protein [Gammaproteobacteria bacterium]|nr:nucleotidyltransferase substrate binding protein [Gammaproteobacteria bacterium]MCH9763025.1 nucleotidyltransferase substrate binding protein [Gammaproteobacteria bacterium]